MATDTSARPWVPEHPTVPRPAEAGIAREQVDLTDAVVAGRATLVTTHPSALLRLRGRGGYDDAFAAFVADPRTAADAAVEPKEQRHVP